MAEIHPTMGYWYDSETSEANRCTATNNLGAQCIRDPHGDDVLHKDIYEFEWSGIPKPAPRRRGWGIPSS